MDKYLLHVNKAYFIHQYFALPTLSTQSTNLFLPFYLSSLLSLNHPLLSLHSLHALFYLFLILFPPIILFPLTFYFLSNALSLCLFYFFSSFFTLLHLIFEPLFFVCLFHFSFVCLSFFSFERNLQLLLRSPLLRNEEESAVKWCGDKNRKSWFYFFCEMPKFCLILKIGDQQLLRQQERTLAEKKKL